MNGSNNLSKGNATDRLQMKGFMGIIIYKIERIKYSLGYLSIEENNILYKIPMEPIKSNNTENNNKCIF